MTVRGEGARSRLLEMAAMALGLTACAYAVGTAAWVVVQRWQYRYELEWTEGHIARIVERAMEGQPVYHAPTPDWMPLAYTPLFYLASAGAAAARGLDIPTLRLVSILGSCLAAFGLAWIAARTAGRWWAAAAVAGLLAAAFRPSGFWFDVARGDMLMLGLACTGLAVLHRAERAARWAAGALLLALAFWAKQPAVFFLAAGGALAFRRGRGAGWAYGLAATVGVLVPLVLLHAATAGWSSFCIFGLAATSIDLSSARVFVVDDLLFTWWPSLILAAGCVLLAREARSFLVAVAIAGLAAALGGRLREGGYDNVLLPLHASVALLGAAGLAAWVGRSRRLAALAWTLVAAQVAWTAYPPRAQVPSERDRAFWDAFLVRVGGMRGEVLIPTTAFVQQRVGKASNAMWLPVMELEVKGSPEAAAFRASLRERVASGRVGAVVLTDEGGAFGMEPLFEGWRQVDLGLPREGGYPVTGWAIRPRWLLLPPAGALQPGSR